MIPCLCVIIGRESTLDLPAISIAATRDIVVFVVVDRVCPLIALVLGRCIRSVIVAMAHQKVKITRFGT